MTKIYNEILIDMNPESPTFEETIYEDSFEHSGELMLAQQVQLATMGDKAGTMYFDASGNEITESQYKAAEYDFEYTLHGNTKKKRIHPAGYGYVDTYNEYEYISGSWVATGRKIPKAGSTARVSKDESGQEQGLSFEQFSNTAVGNVNPEWGKVKTHGKTYDKLPTFAEAGSEKWGAEDISKEDFFDKDGNPLPVGVIASQLDARLPGITGQELIDVITDLAPKYQAVDPMEEKFLGEQRAFAEKEAGMAKQADMYGLQKEAGKLGAQARGAYGGMGAGMRGAMGGQQALGKAFGVVGEQYGLAKEKAEAAETKGLYGLEKTAEKKWESELADFLEPDWFKREGGGGAQVTSESDWESIYGVTPGEGTTGGREGGYVHKDRSGIGENRRFNSKTFLDVLTKLPDAGCS